MSMSSDPLWSTSHLAVRPYGDCGYLIDVAQAPLIPSLFNFLRSDYVQDRRRPIVDVIPAERSILVISTLPAHDIIDIIEAWDPSVEQGAPARIIDIPTRYNGPDLEEVARQWNVDIQAVIDIHVATTFTCSFCGFLPGFAYLTGLPQHYAVRRKATPRTALSAGSVGLAGAYCGIYPRSSPGGWQILGQTEFEPWRIDRDPPGQIMPGDKVRFSEIS
ncbi:MAG: 5-oxoprolinase subunit B family protein [Acidimicrobiales bacterium]